MKKKMAIAIIGVVYPWVLLFFCEWLVRQSALEAVQWMFGNFGMVLLNSLLWYSLFFLVQVIGNRAGISTLVASLPHIIITLISHLKYTVRGEVLLLNDFQLAGEADGLLSFIEPSMILQAPMILSVLLVLAITIFLCICKIKTRRNHSAIVLGGLLLTTYLVFGNSWTSAPLLRVFGVDNQVRYDVNQVQEKEGVLLGLYSNDKMNQLEVPANYDAEHVAEIMEEVEIAKKEQGSSSGDWLLQGKLPNVIMIMSESFFDPTVLKNIEFSQDPLPNFHALSQIYTSGNLITSTFAGGTSNIEFEAFTGNSIAYLPYGSVPYTDYQEVLKRVDTLPKMMKENGYKTMALHTFDKTFYHRDENYANMGFDEFWGVEELENPEYFGRYLSDETFTRNVIKMIENNPDEPLFIWGVTMQNHTPYATANFDEELEITVDGENLGEVAKDKMTAYANGIYHSDMALQQLVTYLSESDKPTILLFFGDHLPSQYEAYLDTGVIHTKDTTQWNAEEMLQLHTLPFLLYDNFEGEDMHIQNETVGAAFLGNYLCNAIQKVAPFQKSKYFDFLDTLTFQAIRDRLFVDEKGVPSIRIPAAYEEMVEKHKILQYDMMFGEQYLKKQNLKKQ